MQAAKGIRRLGAGVVSAFGLCFAPMAANAAATMYICRDSDGKLDYLFVDVAERTVKMMSGKSPGRCIATYRDGAIADIFSAPPGELCAYSIFELPARQFVSVRGSEIWFGGKTKWGGINYTLNTQSGILEYPGGQDECHRANA